MLSGRYLIERPMRINGNFPEFRQSMIDRTDACSFSATSLSVRRGEPMFPVGLICIPLAYKLSFFELIGTIRRNYLLTASGEKRPVVSEENRCRARRYVPCSFREWFFYFGQYCESVRG
jgi:hypothetical protein